MPDISSRTVPNNYPWLWIAVAANLLKVNYPLILGVTFLYGGIAVVGLQLGMLGTILTAVLCGLLTPGFLLMTFDFTNSNKSDFDKLFTAFRDQDLRSRMIPLVVFNLVVALLNGFLTKQNVTLGFFISLVTMPITYFAVPLITFHKISFLDSISYSLNAVIKNIVPFLIFAALAFLLMLVLGLLLVLPLIFYGLPIMLLVYYPIYASIFLNFDVKTFNESFKAKLAAPSRN